MKDERSVIEVPLSEFRNTGLPVFVNQILHIFGYAIGFEIDEKTHEVKRMFPMRVKFRGFSEDSITNNYKKLAEYMKTNAKEL